MNALALVAALCPLVQAPDDVLATYQLDGRAAHVTRLDVALEMALHLRRRERGKESAELLADSALARRAAEQHRLLPTETEVRAFWRQLQEQLRAAGRRPEDFPVVRNTSEREWLDDLATQMAQERLVRRELGLGRDEPVSGDMLKLWLAEARKRTTVVTDPDQLPIGTAVRVGTTDVPLLDLGMLLLRTSEDEERDRFVRQVAYLNVLEAEARKAGVVATAADLDRAIDQRRRDAADDPRYRGATLDSILRAEGLTAAALRELRVFRAQVLLDKLARQRFPTASLAAELLRDRQAVLDLVGPRRRIGIVFVRALDEPNELIRRDFDAAAAVLVQARERLATESFANIAAIESEHGPSKLHGGDVGWHRRQSGRLPEPVLRAAFALPAGQVSMPVRAADGCYLVAVLDVEPPPTDEDLIARLRDERARALGQQLLRQADVQLTHPQALEPR